MSKFGNILAMKIHDLRTAKHVMNGALTCFLLLSSSKIIAAKCCENSGINYCDSSSEHYVCNNGAVSACYCGKRAVSDMIVISGCCTWQGGIYIQDILTGDIICRDGSVSPVCNNDGIVDPLTPPDN
jgi:hypothetical protein